MSETVDPSAATPSPTTPAGPAGAGQWPSPEVTAILSQYGQAMMRLGQMERELEELKKRAPIAVATPSAPSQDIQAMLQEKKTELMRKDETIASLRLQVSTLTSQLARTEEKLKMASEGNYVAHRRRHRRKWWQFWRRSSQSMG